MLGSASAGVKSAARESYHLHLCLDCQILSCFALPGMRAALASRDISTVYRLLMQAGVAQRVIARVLADITLARLHVQTGEPDAPQLAASAISAVAPLRSGVARAGLAPLAAELETRPRSDLASWPRRARQVAASSWPTPPDAGPAQGAVEVGYPSWGAG